MDQLLLGMVLHERDRCFRLAYVVCGHFQRRHDRASGWFSDDDSGTKTGACIRAVSATFASLEGWLNGLSVILILTMSCIGGSMVPRYLMSDELRQYGLWTFNAWALDGYTKVFGGNQRRGAPPAGSYWSVELCFYRCQISGGALGNKLRKSGCYCRSETGWLGEQAIWFMTVELSDFGRFIKSLPQPVLVAARDCALKSITLSIR